MNKEFLIEKDDEGRTPLHLATINGYMDIVKFVIPLIGIENVNPIDRMFKTPYDNALIIEDFHLVNYLKIKGGEPGYKDPIVIKSILRKVKLGDIDFLAQLSLANPQP